MDHPTSLLTSPRRDDREAYLLADLCAAVEAGLTAEQILNGPSTATLPGVARSGTTLSEGLLQKGLHLAPHELLMLETSERAGSLPRTLRALSVARSRRAERFRQVCWRLAYPAFLLVMGLGFSLLLGVVMGRGLSHTLTAMLVLAGLVGGAYWFVRSAMRRPDARGSGWIGKLMLELGELPYLQAMHGLYGAGVKIHEAHALASLTSPVESVRVQLDATATRMRDGATWSEALNGVGALHTETRQMLATAELSGDLEAALDRAVTRRQASIDQQTRRLLVAVVALCSVLVYGYVIYFILDFWSSYYSGLNSALGR
ncbi:MAG: type II secretion system F family protein [Planctomycetes bacterium]|nr:type II secretion system F family protein [Planctomycetota bacterium]MCB9868696.1 type II secretion system F family protein [Planctomycetota bacterium]